MGATATLNIRLPEDLKDHGIQVLAKRNISVSEAVRQLFCELERSQQIPDFLEKAGNSSAVKERRELLQTMISAPRKAPDVLDPPVEPEGHDWKADWYHHLLEKHGGASE